MNAERELPDPPIAEKRPHATHIHGETLTDDYFWLRDKSDPAVIPHLTAEEEYTTAVMQPTEALQQALYDEILSHIKQTDDSVPYRDGDYFYYVRTREGRQYPIFCRKHLSLEAPEEVFLDQNELAHGHAFFSIGARAISRDGKRLAYSVDTTGYRQYTLQIKDLETGALLPDRIERVDDAVWASDNRTIVYTTEDPVTKRHNKVFRHVAGTHESELIYEETDELFDLGVYRSRDRAFIFIHSASKTSTEVRYLRASHPEAEPTLILTRRADHEYDVDHRDGRFYIRTNKDAKNFRVVTAPVGDPSEDNWIELVAHRPDVKVSAGAVFARHLVLIEWEHGLQQLEILDLKTFERHRIGFPEPVYSAGLGPNAVYDTSIVRYTYQSLVTPPSVLDYDMDRRESKLLKETEVPGGFDRANYRSERVFATASDGTRIPISLVCKRDVPIDGTAPLLLYAYGSYGSSIPPYFAASRLPLLDRGVVYAFAHVRGGGELGEEWREQGRMMKKMNTFTDFIACAEFLIRERYTSADRLIIQGGSAGGLLVGVVVNLRPDLFRGAILQVPFVDVVNTMLDDTLPLTTSEYIEWGNPNEKPAFDYIRSYSPYDNVRAQNYPAMLVKTSINDSQVPFWEGAKLVAKLRELKTDSNQLLLKTNFGAGHGGASGRYDAIRETAFNWAWVLSQVRLGTTGHD